MACALGMVGFVSPILIGITFTVCLWWIRGSNEFDRSHDLRWLPTYLADPAIVTAILFAAAGWASFAPRTPHRFATTLMTMTVISIPTWCLLFAADNGSRHPLKGDDIPLVDPYRVLLFAVPPFLLAAMLSAVRSRARLSGEPKKCAFDEL